MEKKEIKKYEKPKIIRQSKMTFPIDIINAFGKQLGKGSVCKQCTACHTCR